MPSSAPSGRRGARRGSERDTWLRAFYTPLRALYTWLRTLYTWLRALYTWRRALYTWLRASYTWLRALYTWLRTLYTWRRALYTWLRALYTPLRALYTPLWALYTPLRALYTTLRALYTPLRALYTRRRALYKKTCGSCRPLLALGLTRRTVGKGRARGAMGKTKQDDRPSRDFSQVTQVGQKALLLANKYATELKGRLDPTVTDGLVLDLKTLGIALPGALVGREVSKAARLTQDEALAEGHLLVSAYRTAVARMGAPPDVRKAYGVGTTTNPKVVKRVKAAIQQIIDRAEAQPAEAASFGILPKDVQALKDALQAITDADDDQEQKRAGAPLKTKERNRAGNRILVAVDQIVAAGVMEFARDKDKRAEFEALVGK
jgi:hypothetical protein